MLGEIIRFLFLITSTIQASENRTEAPDNGKPLTGNIPIVQRPLDGQGREIMTCSLKLGETCQTSFGKTWSSYCSCGEGLKCEYNICILKNEEEASTEEYSSDQSSSTTDAYDINSENSEPIVQRPLGFNGREIKRCYLEKGDECGTDVGKSWSSYCECAEDLKCLNNVCVVANEKIASEEVPFDPIDMVQRPLDVAGRLILECSLGLNDSCETGRGKDVHNYCTCGRGLVCVGQKCKPDGSGTEPLQPGMHIDKVHPKPFLPVKNKNKMTNC